jgi:lysophospholipase L1-like esterase
MCSPGRPWPWTPGAGAPIVAAAGQHWVFTGDSIITPPVGWDADLKARIETLVGGSITVTNTAQAGYTAVEMAHQVHNRVGIYNPDVVAITIGLNDIRVATAGSVIAAAVASILYGIRAECPNAQILLVGMWMFGEQWLSGPLRWAPASDHNIDTINALIATECTTYGAAHPDVRGPALVYESLHNTPEPGVVSGVLTNDGEGIHPDTAAGRTQMSDAVMTYVTA